MVKYFLITLTVIILLVLISVFRPVPIVSESKAISENGIVSNIYSNQSNDIIFVFENKQRRFYINRGLENNIELDDLKDKLIGNSIIVKYPMYWMPLDWNNSVRHISKLEFNDEVLFNELKG